jgi:hypothetical protein
MDFNLNPALTMRVSSSCQTVSERATALSMIDLKCSPRGRGGFRNNYEISCRAPETPRSKKVEL